MPSSAPRSADEIVEAEFERVLAELRTPESQSDLMLANGPAPPGPDPEATYITEEVIVSVRNMLGIKRESWDRVMPEVRSLIPKYALRKIAARVSLNMGFESIGQLKQAIELGTQIMESKGDKTVEAMTRVAAGKMVAHAVEAMGKMFPELLRLAEASGDKTAADDKMAGAVQNNRPRNLPPMLSVNGGTVQVNYGGPPTPSPGGPPFYPQTTPANSGKSITVLSPSK